MHTYMQTCPEPVFHPLCDSFAVSALSLCPNCPPSAPDFTINYYYLTENPYLWEKRVQHSPIAHRLKMSQICVTYRHSLRRKAGCLSGFPLNLFKTFLRPWSSKMKACSFQLFFVICPSGRKAADINRESINSAWNYQFSMRKEEIFRESNKLFFRMKVE